MKYTDYKSFTMVEMLMVIVIIGILAVAIVPRLVDTQDRARDATRRLDLNTVSKGIELYSIDHEGYPTMTDAASGTGRASVGGLIGLLTPYISPFPRDIGHGLETLADGSCVRSGDDYAYYVTESGGRFVLTAQMESGRGNTVSCDGVLAGDDGHHYYMLSSGRSAVSETTTGAVLSGS